VNVYLLLLLLLLLEEAEGVAFLVDPGSANENF
jgi:hypothetical protein